jgi:tRNA (cytidine/uridine-2'-O-)-methyltransferase
MDYAELASVTVHPDWAACRAALGAARLFALTTKASRRTADAAYLPGDAFVFGAESCGLPPEVLADITANHRLRLPLIPGNRSLNLSNAVAVMVYEAWRQQGYAGGD